MADELLPPWDAIDPELTGARLQAISMLIVQAREQKISRRHRWDRSWNLGCDCYAWTMSAIREAADGEHRGWLRVDSAPGDMDFLFRIGAGAKGVPVKFYRPDSDGQPGRTLRQCYDELRVQQLRLGLPEPKPLETLVRIAVETGEDGAVMAVTLVRFNAAHELNYAWPCWFASSQIRDLRSVARPEGVELGEPPVGDEIPRSVDAREGTNDQGES